MVSTQDEFAVSFSKEEQIQKVEDLIKTKNENEARSLFRLCTQNQWNYEKAKEELRKNLWREEVCEILYRPFDLRWTVYNSNVAVHRRDRVMKHMLAGENIGLSIPRSIEIGRGWEHVFCSQYIIQHHMVSIKEVNYLFPLYLYDDDSLFAEAKGKRRPNVAPKFIEEITNKTNLKFQMDGKGDLVKSFGPEDVFNYVYCVLYSSSFRKKYSEYLKRDFARIPIPGNLNSFKDLSELGKRLVEMHTLSSMAKSEIKFPETGTDIIEIVKLEGNKIFINSVQYFENVANSTWEFHVGGYQVCEKWLKDRKGKKLNFNDIKTYQNILSNVLETTEVIKKIELVVKDYGGWPLS